MAALRTPAATKRTREAPSTVSQTPYNRRFGGWTAALVAFVNYANAADLESPNKKPAEPIPSRRTTGRDPSLRKRWNILQRDRFTCRGCGRSPATTMGIALQVDHIIPWSKGARRCVKTYRRFVTAATLENQTNQPPDKTGGQEVSMAVISKSPTNTRSAPAGRSWSAVWVPVMTHQTGRPALCPVATS